ncbi:hypothetical protein AYJ05_12415 [Corynebacterium stationis]|uniref:Uncharacterized protein n=1 Tax=Corynebacterium stationis TaxID=1705 RepID=A0A177ITH1_9CORY|nr:helix-turn-helix transcriptional regulator [Corynebacterium stationis]OAH32168.1 hypothetical protein AYJ05_12415 [Corynebacterium stationis]
MNERYERREALGITQVEAANRASVSLATWRRWEADPESVGVKSRNACNSVLDKGPVKSEDSAWTIPFVENWAEPFSLTPRQAAAISVVLNGWSDLDIKEWLAGHIQGPLHEQAPFCYWDLRVMMRVNDNRAWAALVAERCEQLSDELEKGRRPWLDRGPFINELLIGTSIQEAKESLDDLPELFEDIPARKLSDQDDDEEAGAWTDEDWDLVESELLERGCWEQWEFFLYRDHPLTPHALETIHPYTWFDIRPFSAHETL